MNSLKKQSQNCPTYLQTRQQNHEIQQNSQSTLTSVQGEEMFHQQKLGLSNIIGNFNKNFILVYINANGNIYLMDQHAASQKSLYLQLLQQNMVKPQLHQQQMEIDNIYREVLDEQSNRLKDLGWKYQIKDYGKNKMNVNLLTVPSIYGQKTKSQEFIQIIESIYLSEKQEYSQSQKHKIATIACHNSYRFGDVLSKGEMRGLIDSMHKLNGAFNCPHGRPILIGMGSFQKMKNTIKKKKVYRL